MSRQIDIHAGPLSADDREYLEVRGHYHLIRLNEEQFGTKGGKEPEETEESLARQIADLEGQAEALRARQTALRLAREQEEARVQDNTVVDGKGGQEPVADGLENLKNDELRARIEAINEDEVEEGEDELSTAGNKAQLIERIRAWRTEHPEPDEDDEEDED